MPCTFHVLIDLNSLVLDLILIDGNQWWVLCIVLGHFLEASYLVVAFFSALSRPLYSSGLW